MFQLLFVYSLLICSVRCLYYPLREHSKYSLGVRSLSLYDVLKPKAELTYHWGDDPEGIRHHQLDHFQSVRSHTLISHHRRYVSIESIEPMLVNGKPLCQPHAPSSPSSPPRNWTITFAFHDPVAMMKARQFWQEHDDQLLFVMQHDDCHAGKHERSIYKAIASPGQRIMVFHERNSTIVLPLAIPVVAHHDGTGHRTGEIPNPDFAALMRVRIGPRDEEQHANLVHVSRQATNPYKVKRCNPLKKTCRHSIWTHFKDDVKEKATKIDDWAGNVEEAMHDLEELAAAVVKDVEEGKNETNPQISFHHNFHTDHGERHQVLPAFTKDSMPQLYCLKCHAKGNFTFSAGFEYDFKGDEARCKDLHEKHQTVLCHLRKHFASSWVNFNVTEDIDIRYQYDIESAMEVDITLFWEPGPDPPRFDLSTLSLDLAPGLSLSKAEDNDHLGDLDKKEGWNAEKKAEEKEMRASEITGIQRDGMSMQTFGLKIGLWGQVGVGADATMKLPGYHLQIPKGQYGHVDVLTVNNTKDYFRPSITVIPMELNITNPSAHISQWAGLQASVAFGTPAMKKQTSFAARFDFSKFTVSLSGETNTDKFFVKNGTASPNIRDGNAVRVTWSNGLSAHLHLFRLSIDTNTLAKKISPWGVLYWTEPLFAYCFKCHGNHCINNMAQNGSIAINMMLANVTGGPARWVTEKLMDLINGRPDHTALQGNEDDVRGAPMSAVTAGGTVYRQGVPLTIVPMKAETTSKAFAYPV